MLMKNINFVADNITIFCEASIIWFKLGLQLTCLIPVYYTFDNLLQLFYVILAIV